MKEIKTNQLVPICHRFKYKNIGPEEGPFCYTWRNALPLILLHSRQSFLQFFDDLVCVNQLLFQFPKLGSVDPMECLAAFFTAKPLTGAALHESIPTPVTLDFKTLSLFILAWHVFSSVAIGKIPLPVILLHLIHIVNT